jgi:CheY-like chemotaxis protein
VARILVVDDDLDIRREVSEILREEGVEVTTARHGSEALHVLRGSVPPSVILLDLMMPGTDGWQFRRAQLADPALAGVPVVVFSSFSNGPRNVADLRVSGFITKPFTIGQLLTALKKYL